METLNFKDQSPDKSQNSKVKSVFDLEERMAVFGESVIRLCRALKKDEINRPLVNQIIRSATSIGANYCEANNASSKKDFRNKAYIAKKECQETKHWLRMLATATPENAQALRVLWTEAHELLLILQAILNKVNQK